MYGLNDGEPERDTLDQDLDEVVGYLNHCNKKEHAQAVMTAIRRLAAGNDRVERLYAELRELRHRDNHNHNFMKYEEGRRQPEQILKLPVGARKVSIEL